MNDVVLDDDEVLDSYGLKEGSVLQLKIDEEKMEELEAQQKEEEGIVIKVEFDVPGQVKVLKLKVEEDETLESIKHRCYEGFTEMYAYTSGVSEDGYGLFILKSPQWDEYGDMLQLRRNERLFEDKTVKELELDGSRDIIMASLFWYNHWKK
eukprot:TRINITY_DN29081_c0_g1_i1.p1 TRINITY_DN29081_c0_g1~~TRINITY_DN29081_c0_g1_i1.p1  ORF type:complete len:152 (+),score=40.97 TRINITY_DN29081_c0_g1_i1:3-458(+)